MRLALKVVLATVFGMLLVLAVSGWLLARRAIALFEADMRKDHRLIASTLGVSVASTWRTSGVERALDLIARADDERPGLRIGWVFPDGSQRAAPPLFPSFQTDLREIQHAVLGSPEQFRHDFLVSRVPVRDRGVLLGAIEIAESLEVRDNYTRSSVSHTVIATLSVLAISGVVVLVLGVWLVGRPLRELALAAKRIGQGDLAARLHLRQRDEIGELAAEMNAMCDRLAEAHAKTEAETAARIATLEQLRHADRLITVGRLAAGVAHELGTPLNVVAGRLKMLRRGNLERPQTDDYLAGIGEQVERMVTIIRQLTDFARRRGPKIGVVDLSAVTSSTARFVAPIAKKHGVILEVLPSEKVRARGDATQLEQVLSNLVINAVHASPEGGRVEISCGNEDGERSARVYMRVEDHGHGMDEATSCRVFEPFFTTKDIGQGTGLGLSVAHGIVADHGGAIVVRSEQGRGSVFCVFLPRADA